MARKQDCRVAAFGPGKVDDEGLWGHLLPIRMFYGQDSPDGTRSNTGCPSTELKHAPKTPSILSSFFGAARKPPKDWIALVERGDCSFTDKVRLAQELGAIAVVVGDAQYEYDEDSQIDRLISLRDIPWDNDEIDQGETRPITMHPDGDTSDIVIPSCFVIRSTYLELLDLVHKSLNNSHALFSKGGKGLEVGLFLDISIPDLSALDLGMLLLFLPSILTIVFVIIQQIKTVVKQYRERASVRAVRNLPSYEWHADRPWSLLVGSSDKEPPPKGAGIFPYVAWYLTRQFDRLRQIIARQRNRAYAPLDNASDPLTEAPVALAPQDTLPATNLPTAIPIHAASTAADIRRYAQDTCPICLCVFEDGYVLCPQL
ncbi:RING-type E3 ubiquitin transferase [Malassezia psittaci]|uniref:RING-type E3 ubiquitin transferase n=1 Tax=Malassezia psittaci TaxID=1821823 RepID=A0AAF0F5R6_9BASI|nr:RING-type E3 ubiquitin transferase [Malassezia psittaci]